MSPEIFLFLLRAVAIVLLGTYLSQADFNATLANVRLGDLQALVLLAACLVGFK